MNYYAITRSNSLQHHGVKGMKWGVRRYQNKDGTLTKAGKKKYNTDVEKASQKVIDATNKYKIAAEEYNLKTSYGLRYDKKAINEVDDAYRKVKYAKEDLKFEKIKQKINNETKPKSNRRLKLEKQYLDKGMTEEEAAVAAYKRIKTEKIIAITAGVAITSAAAYVAYKQYDRTVDKFIHEGSELQNISSRADKIDGILRKTDQGVSDAFYASLNSKDDTKYRGLYGDQIKQRGKNAYEAKMKVTENIKIASEKSATNALKELVKENPEYAKMLKTELEEFGDGQHQFNSTHAQRSTIKKGMRFLDNGKVNSRVYNALNLTLADHESPAREDFYNKLKSKGYDAIEDINDKKLSGYRSKQPVIVFNGKGKLNVKNVRQLGEDEIEKAKAKGVKDIYIKTLAPRVVYEGSAFVGAYGLTKLYKSKTNDKIVRDYKKEHPNTSLSYKEIIRNYGKD